MNATMTATAANGEFVAPTRIDGLKELRAGWDLMRLAVRTPELLRAPRGDGRAVVVVPGLRASDASLAPLRSFLAQRGHDVRPWGRSATAHSVSLRSTRPVDHSGTARPGGRFRSGMRGR